MSQKVLWVDTETTGTNPYKHGVIQLSGMIEIDGEIVEKFDLRMRPAQSDEIDPQAMEVHGKTTEEVMAYPDGFAVLQKFKYILDKHCDKYDKNDKFIIAGYNVKFDLEMIHSFCKKRGEKYIGSYLGWVMVDGLPLVHYLVYKEGLKLPDYKLKTVCDHFGIEIKAHDAMSDIEATRDLITLLEKKIKEVC